MIVGLPRGTAIGGQDLTGWATDMFMSRKNQRQKNEYPESDESVLSGLAEFDEKVHRYHPYY